MNTYVRNPRWQVYFSQGYSEKENLSTTPMESKIGKYSFNLYQIFLYQHGFLNKTIGVPAFFFFKRKETYKHKPHENQAFKWAATQSTSFYLFPISLEIKNIYIDPNIFIFALEGNFQV